MHVPRMHVEGAPSIALELAGEVSHAGRPSQVQLLAIDWGYYYLLDAPTQGGEIEIGDASSSMQPAASSSPADGKVVEAPPDALPDAEVKPQEEEEGPCDPSPASVPKQSQFSALKPFVIISTSYLLYTMTDGAIRMIVLLYAYNLGFSAW